jgi:hypothetical protein
MAFSTVSLLSEVAAISNSWHSLLPIGLKIPP